MIETIYVGATANDGTGDPLRDAMIIVNNNFQEIQNDYMLITGTLSISQVAGLQTILTNIQTELNNIPLLQQDIVDINTIISSINSTLNNQNLSILELQSDLSDLITLVNTKIGEAPIDGNEYVRKDGDWVIKTETTHPIEMLSTYDGVRLSPTSATVSGFYVNHNGNIRTGYSVVNPSTGNGAVAGILASNTEDYAASMSMQFFGVNYYIPHLRSKGAIYSQNEIFNITINNSDFTWRTGPAFLTTEEIFKIKGTKVVKFYPATQSSITPETGDFILNSSDSNRINLYNGSSWKEVKYKDDSRVIQATGSIIDFTTEKIFNTATASGTGNITNDLTAAQLGIIQKIYHNDSVEPTVAGGWVLIGGEYTTSELNIIYAEWCGSNRVEYWITTEQ